ncbi:MAG: hypothetical protein QG654_139 [Patescibacteria group bacterium]|nr:hypothetical protein [Patescibacteria group bacterium]
MNDSPMLRISLGVIVLITLYLAFNRRISPEEKVSLAFEEPVSSLEYYDITRYATGEDHESRVYEILRRMPRMETSADVETYIRDKFPESPLNGEMVTRRAVKHGVNVHLMLAIMQQDSGLGTKGKGARSRNPGNVGTYRGRMNVYTTWGEGVEAVAKWLKKHKKKKASTQACWPSSVLPTISQQSSQNLFYRIL